MDTVKQQKPWHHAQTGTTGKEMEQMEDWEGVTRIDEDWPADNLGNKMSLGNSVAHTYKLMPEGTISMRRGYDDPAEDPAVSQAQNRAMHAAASGHSNLGIPKKVGQKFVSETHGHKVSDLPERVKHRG